jgi:hypothetical protein
MYFGDIAMNKLLILPDIDGYEVTFKETLVSNQAIYGNSRQRKDFDQTSVILNCKWTVNKSDYLSLIAFFKINQSFNIDLILLQSDLLEYVANIIPNSLSLASQNGDVYVLKISLEILPDLSLITFRMELIKITSELGLDTFNVLLNIQPTVERFKL